MYLFFSGVFLEGSTQSIISLFHETGLIHSRSIIKISFYTPESNTTLQIKMKTKSQYSCLEKS